MTSEVHIEIRQLRYFVRIVDMGSFSRAALELHIAQSALSQHVAALEAETRAMLLVRTSRGVQATDAGRTLYQHARIILQQEAEAKAAVEVAAGVPTGQLAFGLPLSLVRELGMPIFCAVRASWPGIELQVQEELSGTILEWLKCARLTLGIAFDDHNLAGLHTVPLFEERLFLIVSPQSIFARRKTISLMEVAALTLVLPSYGQGVRACVDKAFTDAGLGEAKVSMEIDSHVMLKQCANLGTGPTILSWASVELEVLRKELVAIEIVRMPVTRTAHVCMQPGGLRSPIAQCVLQELRVAVRASTRRPSWRGVRSLDP